MFYYHLARSNLNTITRGFIEHPFLPMRLEAQSVKLFSSGVDELPETVLSYTKVIVFNKYYLLYWKWNLTCNPDTCFS